MATRALKLVAPEPETVEPEAKHIGDEMRAEISRRDWAKVHIAADRRPLVAWADAPRRLWSR